VLTVAVAALAACATPENIRTKSTASAQLYADILAAHGTFSRAVEQELLRRDRRELETAVRLGQRPPQLEAPFTPPDDTVRVMRTLEAWQLEVATLRLLYGTVDRFLQIEVVDLDDIKAVTEKASDAFKGQ
jgi:hypothetical protein